MLELIKNRLNNQFTDQIIWVEGSDWPTFKVSPNYIKDVIGFLFHDADLKIQFLTDITAVHYPENIGNELEIVYHLHQLANNQRIRIKTSVSIQDPSIPSITDIFSGADWMERETFDFFGVNFLGHPNLKRILNADEMDYHPMRKEYPMEDPTRTDKDDEMFGRGNDF